MSERIDDLESRVAFQEDMIQSLNSRIAEQDQELAKLSVQLKHLNDKLRTLQEGDSSHDADERPPHY